MDLRGEPRQGQLQLHKRRCCVSSCCTTLKQDEASCGSCSCSGVGLRSVQVRGPGTNPWSCCRVLESCPPPRVKVCSKEHPGSVRSPALMAAIADQQNPKSIKGAIIDARSSRWLPRHLISCCSPASVLQQPARCISPLPCRVRTNSHPLTLEGTPNSRDDAICTGASRDPQSCVLRLAGFQGLCLSCHTPPSARSYISRPEPGSAGLSSPERLSATKAAVTRRLPGIEPAPLRCASSARPRSLAQLFG
ncbi:hypothetical protein PSPO01_00846 [Paraphaeosphaeria sporulosa]